MGPMNFDHIVVVRDQHNVLFEQTSPEVASSEWVGLLFVSLKLVLYRLTDFLGEFGSGFTNIIAYL